MAFSDPNAKKLEIIETKGPFCMEIRNLSGNESWVLGACGSSLPGASDFSVEWEKVGGRGRGQCGGREVCGWEFKMGSFN